MAALGAVGVGLDVGCQALAVFEDGIELGADGGDLRFEVGDPGKFLALVEIALGQAGEVEAGRLLEVEILAAGKEVDCLLQPWRARSRIDRAIEMGFEIRVAFSAQLARLA